MNALNILLTDDDHLNLMIIERHLIKGFLHDEANQYNIMKAYNGHEALSLVAQHHFDLVLLDWEMPEMDGIEVLKILKANPLTVEIPVMMVTSNTSSEYLKEAIGTGAVDFIKKPIDPIELIARVKSVIKVSTAYQQIKKQNIEINDQKEQITASINYARRMQKAMLPSDELLAEMSTDFFVLNQPKDIVSGDFYWAAIIDQWHIFIVADCTGHGVPGAMMSMIGNNLLNEIIKNKNIYSPDLILNHLHQGVRLALNQQESNSRDGMDIGIVVYDSENQSLAFSGAMNNLLLINDGNVFDIQADRKAVGGKQLEDSRCFTKHVLDVSRGDTHFYLYTDGYHDQFGGLEFKKFFVKRFKDLLVEDYKLPKKQQEMHLKQVMTDWMEGYLQMDDILVMGVKL